MPRDVPREFPWRAALGLAAGVALAALVIAMVMRGRPVPDGPVEVVWNQQPCAHCRMLVGEPPHAAQLVTLDGDVLVFDDPGCLIHYLDDHSPAVHRLWFHDSTGPTWLAPDDVGFVPAERTPMGYGLAAVPRSAAGAISLPDARARLIAGATP